MKRKTFDCVELQHQGGDLITARTRGMTREELVAYWRERTEELLELQRALKAKEEAVPQPPEPTAKP